MCSHLVPYVYPVVLKLTGGRQAVSIPRRGELR